MKHFASFPCRVACLVWLAALLTPTVPAQSTSQSSEPIPVSELGEKAGAQYHGDGLSVSSTPEGARLRCVFQKLEGQVTSEGLWLVSTVEPKTGEKFRLVAKSVGRSAAFEGEGLNGAAVASQSGVALRFPPQSKMLPATGTVEVADKHALFIRPGLVEEYSVSVDGVRQDFIIESPPLNSQPSTLNQSAGDLLVELALTGAQAAAAAYGAKLTLDGSRRKLAYSRLHVVDAKGRELAANLEVLSADRIVVRVADATAAYPVRIDPCFSDEDWTSLNGFTGANNVVNAIAVDSIGNVYIGGNFTYVGTSSARYIAMWNGTVWTNLSSGINNVVYALAASGTDLYVGGFFTTAGGVTVNRVAKWNFSTSAWSALGLGVNNQVLTLAMNGTDLYAGGDFTAATNSGPTFVTVNRVARWNFSTSTWSALGSGMNSTVSALAISDTDLYAGGAFTFATNSGPTSVAVSRIARWNFSTPGWSPLGLGMNINVYALALNATDLYAAGAFTFATNSGPTSVSVNRIAKWNFSTPGWSPLGSGLNSTVNALALNGTDLYVGGSFTTANPGASPITVNRIAKWNFGTGTWSAIGLGMNNIVNALALNGADVYAGGAFTMATNSGPASVIVNYVTKWSGSGWSVLGQGSINNTVYALAVYGSDLYAGGDFTNNAGVALNRIAKWNGSTWSALGSGITGFVNSTVQALAVIETATDTNLYVGGYFSTAGGLTSPSIAKWRIPTGTWSAVGRTDYGTILAMAAKGKDLYVAGSIGWVTNLGPTTTITVNNIAKWDTESSTWSALGPGLTNHAAGGQVRALAVQGDDLYAGGVFTRAGAVVATNIAKWHIPSGPWSPLGLGANGAVYALAVMETATDTNLYAGGSFNKVGPNTYGTNFNVSYIAKWNIPGSTWSVLRSGINNTVYSLTVSGPYLYAGGVFAVAGGVVSPAIIRWSGGTWSAMGSGLNNSVWALAADAGGHLYVGGSFIGLFGGLVSPFVAKAYIGDAVPEIIVEQPVGNILDDGTAIINYGSVNVGSTADRDFTIKNIGTADLTGLGITIDGPNAAMFSVTANPTAPVSGPDGSTSFTVRFAPTNDAKTNHAALHIASNDCEEAPFDIILTNAGPLTIQCAAPLTTNTIGCATSRALKIPEELRIPTYSGGDVTPILKVRFAGEAGDYLVPSSLTFPIGVTNLVWTFTAGLESVSCTQQVAVVAGVNQSPTIVPVLPPPTVMAINSSTQVTLLVSDAETATTSLSVSSSSGGLVTVTPPSGSPNANSNYTLTITAGGVTGAATITNIVTDGCGATKSNIFTLQVNQPPTLAAIPDQTVVAKSSTTATLTVPFRVTGSGTITPSASQVPPPGVVLPTMPPSTFQITAQLPVFSGSGPDRTVLLGYGIPFFTPFMSSTYGLFPAHAQFTLTVTDGIGLTASRTFPVHLIDAPDVDGVSDAVENGAPNGGDGNSDGIQDSAQWEVASLLTAVIPASYVTLAAPSGTRLANVQALTPPGTPPASFPQGLIQFRLEGLPTVGAAVNVTEIFHGGLPPGPTYFKYGSAAPGAAATYYPFMYGPPGSPTGAEIIPAENKIILHLKDGALGDDDWTENGVIVDPGGPALVAVEQFTLNISLSSATQAQISWPVAAGSLVLQYTDSLALPITWQPDSHGMVTNGSLKSVTVDLTNGTRFYSLGTP